MYESFLTSISRKQWQRLGLARRAGVAAPLFSIYSEKSIGIGELWDLRLLADWCRRVRMSVIQLLPLNDVGFMFRPYDAASGFALDPMYLSLEHLIEVDLRPFRSQIRSLRRRFPPGGERVNYGVKAEKLALLWKIFRASAQSKSTAFARYRKTNRFWLRDYTLFKIIKEKNQGKVWEEWPAEFKAREARALQDFAEEHAESIRFYEWLQWQLLEQFSEVVRYLRDRKILLMGDLPFLASRDSADVWSHQDYFKLDSSSGAPPDAYFFNGQRWGMPPCRWSKMEENSYDLLMERLKYAEHFYDLIRIDHSVGFFRLWTIPVSEPFETGGLNGAFDPPDERLWEAQGRKLLSFMIEHTKMLIVAEDLGTIPECSFRTLADFAIPGMEVARWMRDPQALDGFKSPAKYRVNSVALLSTHDTASFNAWWEYEAGTVYGPLFERLCQEKGIDFEATKPQLFDLGKSFYNRLRWKEEISDATILNRCLGRQDAEILELYKSSYHEKDRYWQYLRLSGTYREKSSKMLAAAALKKMSETASIFSVQLLQDWLAIGDLFKGDSWNVRINFPAVMNESNWSLVMPLALEAMQKLPVNRQIRAIHRQTNRC